MENMYAVILGFIIKINQLFLAVCYELMKGMTDNRLEISEVIQEQKFVFFSSGVQSFSLVILYMTNFLVGALIIYK